MGRPRKQQEDDQANEMPENLNDLRPIVMEFVK
jgi:hypothetical protein